MEQKRLKAELARGELRNIYLLFGDERFLVQYYAAAIENAIGGYNKDVFDGAVAVAEIIMAAETLPFDSVFSAKRLIFVCDSKLFASGRKAESEEMAKYLPKIPLDTIIIFIETEVDRRTRIFKKTVELGGAMECISLSPQDLTKWLIHLAKEKNRKMEAYTADFLIRTCGSNMSNLANEADKLFNFCGEEKEIFPQDIEEICTQTLESRIFDLTKATGTGRVGDALKIYRDMLILKESPIMILTMIIRQLRIILLCKCHSDKNTPKFQIAKNLNIRDFVVAEALNHARRFTTQELISGLTLCQDTDLNIKTGLISQEIGVELLIIKISKKENLI